MSLNQKLANAVAVYREAEKAAPTTTYGNGVTHRSFTKEQRQQIIAALYQLDNNFETAAARLRDMLIEQDVAEGQVRNTSYGRHYSRFAIMKAQFTAGKLRGRVYGDESVVSRPVQLKSFRQLKDNASVFTPAELVKRGLAMGVTNVDTYLELQRPVFDGLLQEARKDSYADGLQADILKTLQNSPYTAKIDKARIESVMNKALSQLVK